MRVLYVCTANICRSASAQRLLREAVAGAPELAGIEVLSAGTAAVTGTAGCSVAPALAGHAHEHRSQPLTLELVDWADLILPAARDHRRAILRMDPTARTRTFTIRQAGRIAGWIVESGVVEAARERAEGAEDAAVWADRFPPGDPRRDAPALPEDPEGRKRWLVGEMDAARGLPGVPSPSERPPVGPERPFRISLSGWSKGQFDAGYTQSRDASHHPSGFEAPHQSQAHPDDIPDPHVLGTGLHAAAYEQIASSAEALVRLLRDVASRT